MNLSLDYEQFDDDNKYDFVDERNVFYNYTLNGTDIGYGHINSYIRITFVLLLRLGFVLVQMGTVPVENVYRISFFNIFEIGNVIMSYFLIGHMLSFGKSTYKGWLGYSYNFSYNLDGALYGLCACLIGSSQISCFLVGRVHLACSVFTTLLYCSWYQPFLIHWIWSSNGWMNKSKLMGSKVSVKDYGGNLVIHLSSSIIGTMGSLFLGRRLIKMDDLDEHSLGREHSGNTMVGLVFIVLGYIAFNLPTPFFEANRKPHNYVGVILTNNLIAFGAGILIVCLLHLIIFRSIYNYWIIVRCFQGGIAGIISIAAAVDIYTYLESLGISAITSIFFFFFSILIHNTALEDYCNLISSHLIGSIIAVMACPLLANKQNFETEFRKVHILWQFICLCVVIAITTVFAWFVFLIFALCKLLRNKHEVLNHRRAVMIKRYLPKKGLLERLFMIDSKTDHIEPGEEKRKQYMVDKQTFT
ncbi:ammonium transporter 3-like isoform X1 [Diorhabda carinulata]|uniref:ammonium transporter 3-like isoform X1 n=2 Tax=Diorhabda carinulata TaxID=1163345 RepID=UPI00259FE86D|nr:ammonium transporter 3-like isoform X1 [Diorhabda carinulata]